MSSSCGLSSHCKFKSIKCSSSLHCFVLSIVGVLSPITIRNQPGRVAQSVARLTQEPEVPISIPVRPHTYDSPSADSKRVVVSYWRKNVHEVLVSRLGGLSLPRKSVVRLTDRPDMTIVL